MNQYQQLYQAPPYCHYEYQGQGQHYPPSQTQLPAPTLLRNIPNEDYSRKRGLENATSPYRGIQLQGEKKQKAGSPEVFYDMDTGIVRTEQRLDPVNDMILSRLDRLSADLKTTVKSDEIKNLATKEDFVKLSDRLNVQEARLKVLEEEGQQHHSDILLLQRRMEELGQQTADRGVAANVYQQSRYDDRRPTLQRPSEGKQTKRMNLIIEGVPIDVDLYEYIIKLGKVLDITVYMRDLTLVSRLKRRSTHDKRPGPVLVCFVYAHIRDKFLRAKRDLNTIEQYGEVWIKADETIDVRRLKSEFRKIAYQARLRGEDVHFNHERIRIGEAEYFEKDLDKVPEEYKSKDGGAERIPNRREGVQEAPKEQRERERRPRLTLRRPSEMIAERERTATDQNVEDMELGAGAAARITDEIQLNQDEATVRPKTKVNTMDVPIPGKIRKTPHGIVFSRPTAFISNLHECDVEDDDVVHKTNEHGYFYNKAKVYKRPDIAKKIIDEKSPYKLKRFFEGLGENEEWERLSAPTLRRLFAKKMHQHPELEIQLLDTAPYRLIEGSVDSRWGGGEPFSSKKYDDGTFTGNNEFGDIATEYRDKKLAQLRRNKITSK